MDYLRRAYWLAAKDLRLEWRHLEKLASMLLFAVLHYRRHGFRLLIPPPPAVVTRTPMVGHSEG